MPAALEEYKGHTINGDVARIPGTRFWKATGAVVGSDAAGLTNVHPVPGIPDQCESETEAKKILLSRAKEWIDNHATSAGVTFF